MDHSLSLAPPQVVLFLPLHYSPAKPKKTALPHPGLLTCWFGHALCLQRCLQQAETLLLSEETPQYSMLKSACANLSAPTSTGLHKDLEMGCAGAPLQRGPPQNCTSIPSVTWPENYNAKYSQNNKAFLLGKWIALFALIKYFFKVDNYFILLVETL